MGATITLPKTMQRSAVVERAEADGPLLIAISSEAPVERWFGTEVLAHSTKAVDMKRLKRGLPLLLDHDMRRVVGRVENIRMGDDKVLRGEVRFSAAADAQQCESDMRSGIRPDISVGYAVDEVTEDKTTQTFTATRWRPLEASSVAVPADETVGVGRAADRADADIEVPVTQTVQERAMPEPISTPAEPQVRTVVDHTPERKRATEIMDLAKQFQCEDKVSDWIGQGATTEQVRAEILETMKSRVAAAVGTRNDLPLTPKEEKQYSLHRALRIMADERGVRDGLEFEVSDTLRKNREGITYRGGLIVPNMRTMSIGTGTLGGNLKFTEEGDFIDQLRASTILGRAGAMFLTGLQGNVGLPRQTSGGTAYWLAEAGTVTNADIKFDVVTLSPKTLMYSYGVTRQLLAQSSKDVETIIRNDFVRSQAREVDRVFLIGTSTSNEPTGIVNAGGPTITIGSNGGAITWSKVTSLEGTCVNGNAVLDDTAAYITNAKVANDAKNVFKGTAGFLPIYEGTLLNGDMNGYKTFVSSTVPSNLTKGTSTTVCSLLAFVSSFNEVLVGQWGGGGFGEIIVDPYSSKKLGIVEYTSYSLLDIEWKHVSGAGYMPDITTSGF